VDRALKNWEPMSERTWQQIALELANETSPSNRRKLEEELAAALQNGSFQMFGKRDEFRNDHNETPRSERLHILISARWLC
jgi:hypothetical protein